MTDQTVAELQKDLGLALKRRRRSMGINQDELAELANVSRPTIRNLEAGNGTIESLVKAARPLGLVDWLRLLGGATPEISPMEIARSRGLVPRRRVTVQDSSPLLDALNSFRNTQGG